MIVPRDGRMLVAGMNLVVRKLYAGRQRRLADDVGRLHTLDGVGQVPGLTILKSLCGAMSPLAANCTVP